MTSQAEATAVSPQAVISLVADTFDAPARVVSAATRPEEIDGWDSLGHSVLLTRLVRKFGLDMTEELAAPIHDVGELIDRLSLLMGCRAGG